MADDADRIDADRLEADWKRALDSAGEAVRASDDARAIGSVDAAAASDHIRADRKWLRGFRPTLRKLFPRRGG